MSAADQYYAQRHKKPATSQVHHLERQQRYLSSLSHQLRSYSCVPRTFNLYEQMENIKRSLKELMRENEDLLSSFRSARKSARQRFDECEAQFTKMMSLEKDILEYIGRAKVHG